MATNNKGLETPAFNSFVNSWDVPVNANTSAIDEALGGTTTLNATGAVGTSNLTLTQYQKLNLYVTGTMTGNATYVVPSGVGGFWIVYNATSGAYAVAVASGGGGSSVNINQGSVATVYSDGTNIRLINTEPLSNNSVTNAMLAQMANARLKGRSTSGTGDPEDITISQALDLLSSTQGVVPYRGSSAWAALAPGTNGYYLKSQGAGANPVWAEVPATLPSQTGNSDKLLTTNGTNASWSSNSVVRSRGSFTGVATPVVSGAVNATVAKISTGIYEVTMSTPLASAAYQPLPSCYSSTFPGSMICNPLIVSTSKFRILSSVPTLGYVDADVYHFAVFGGF